MQSPEPQNVLGKQTKLTHLFAFFLRIFFKLLYHQFAWAYDLVAWIVSLGDWRLWVLSTTSHIEGTQVLEIGFGPGHLMTELSRKGIRTFGLDESLQMIRLAGKRLRRSGMKANLMRGNALSLPLKAACIQQVVMTFPAEFILNPTALTEVQRVLIKGGTALIIPFAWITGRTPWHRFAAWVNRVSGQAPNWDESSLESLMGKGFEVGWEMIEFSCSKMVLIRLRKL